MFKRFWKNLFSYILFWISKCVNTFMGTPVYLCRTICPEIWWFPAHYRDRLVLNYYYHGQVKSSTQRSRQLSSTSAHLYCLPKFADLSCGWFIHSRHSNGPGSVPPHLVVTRVKHEDQRLQTSCLSELEKQIRDVKSGLNKANFLCDEETEHISKCSIEKNYFLHLEREIARDQ